LKLFKAPPPATLAEIVQRDGLFPQFADPEEVEEITNPVTMGELEITLNWFKKDKSPGLDRWIIEFYLAFYDTIGRDLLKVVEDCKISGRMYEASNSTFIALIPKTDSLISFNDFRPISLCNCLHKIIAKIIANRLKPILSRHISPEQFSFLHNIPIHEAISTAHEALYSIKTKKLKGSILKIDLSKAFHWVSSLYLKMLLTHLGFPPPFINWVMCFITTISFSALINGSASNFFHA